MTFFKYFSLFFGQTSETRYRFKNIEKPLKVRNMTKMPPPNRFVAPRVYKDGSAIDSTLRDVVAVDAHRSDGPKHGFEPQLRHENSC